jgi:hypothetical protein
MKTLISSLFIFSIVWLQSCIQAPNSSRKSTVNSAATNGTGTTPAASYPTFSSDESLYWFSTAKYPGTITLNKNTQDVLYLRGKSIHDFLSTKDVIGVEYYRKQYCVVGNFSSALYKQVRVRAIPIYFTTSTNATERMLRIDIPNGSDSSSACGFSTLDTILPASAAYSLPAICTNCTGQITTTNLNLYEAQTSALAKVNPTLLTLTSVGVRVDLTSNSTDAGSSCTNSACAAKGFDCCVSGQCVMDASEKTNASLDPQYSQAKIDYKKNPLSFINYPNIFYVCSDIAHTPPVTTVPTTTPISDAQSRVNQYLKDYTCTADVTAGNGYANCNYLTNIGTEAAYTAIKKKLAIACGCTASDSDMAFKCPDWGVSPVYPANAQQVNANITDFKCYTPAPVNPIGPITNLNVNVPNRSAPHRFYSTTGTNYDDLNGLLSKAPTTTQEGADFYYLDEYNKMGPFNGSYNINSVLGKMTVDLSHTLPAKEVTVELGKTYILSATSGFFTPCSQCAKDSWFQTFSAHPNSQIGVGLQATGYTTSRDTYSANTTFGNYEDTKFGRACYVPVTMLPLSHQKNASSQVQRQNRLKTQSAFYINGYQRDWYGFNKGALIGSFDGVTWFAIGTGRRATATSTKLFLALNAAFLDLADKTDTIVNIIPDFSANTAADYDYDPDLSLSDPRQNNAATCQKYHQCTADADCVAQLGWEYVCADVSQYKTKWPLFDSDAKETVNQERVGTLFDILSATINTNNGKRCVYRGQGAPCKRDYRNLSDLNKKTFTCAPNFYCASLSSNKFNEEVARSPNEFDDILFGMDANVLGRPLNYVTANRTLSTEIISNIKYNATSAVGLSSADGDDMGMCQPGKLLSAVDVNAHSSPDPSKRTDYISQIGSCDSSTTGVNRFITCPAFDSTSNYVDSADVDRTILKLTQNSCGAESKNNLNVSAFKIIEGLSLLNLHNITQPTLAQDACFRRAGSVCHSDLDCGPNKMHEDTVGTLPLSYFGGTDGEQQYWRESLICGQGTPVPLKGSSNYLDYKLNENRCCREIGKDFTMITKGLKTIVPDNAGTNETLNTSLLTYTNPTANGRYSRYSISKTGLADFTTIPAVVSTTEPAKNQWKVINETGSLTCCGGGWIRKFADGTHDWKVRNRMTIDANNLSCLNFRSPLADSAYVNFTADKVVAASYQREYNQFCKSPDIGGCLQIPYPESSGFSILSPISYDPALKVAPDKDVVLPVPASGFSRIDTSPSDDPGASQNWHEIVNTDAPYKPAPYYFSPYPYDMNPTLKMPLDFFSNRTFDYGVELYLPAYVGWDGDPGAAGVRPADATFIKRVLIKYFYAAPLPPKIVDITKNIATPAQCAAVINYAGTNQPIDGIPTNNTWCIVSMAKTGNRPVINVHADSTLGSGDWTYAGIVIDFKPIENFRGTKVSEPGNALYYMSKLARLELAGIPQITYEPLYCNTDQSKVVPGIFKPALSTRAAFEAGSNTYTTFDPIASYNDGLTTSTTEAPGYGNKDLAGKSHYTYQDKLDHPAVFSSKDFTCCTPLGKTPSTAANCCSGFTGKTSDGKTSICKLPTGTDLNVYFNKFVSNEGVGDDQPEGGLIISGTDSDFNDFTGEPKYREATYAKLQALGFAYCNTGASVKGGGFGFFPPEPFAGAYEVHGSSSANIEDSFPASIVDSVLDFQKNDPTVGKVPFDSGFKWNHHYYCK